MRRHYLSLRLRPALAAVVVLMANAFNVQPALAGSLSVQADTLSDQHALAQHVTHTVSFATGTSGTLQRIDFQFGKATDATGGRPAGLGLGAATLGTISGFNGSNWTLSTSSAGTGLLSIRYLSATIVNGGTGLLGTAVSGGTPVTIPLQEITNSAIEDCQPGSGLLIDTCYLRITTYSDDGITKVDDAVANYYVIEDPRLTFNIEGVSSGTIHNGVTTSITSTGTSLPFGLLKTGTPVYIANKLTITTNAPHGYTVTAYLQSPISGVYTTGSISPFGALNATWSTPQSWSSPSGTAANTNSGWFGANTTDTRVSGWSSGTSGKFGPISGSAHTVAYSSGPDRTGSVVYITYGLEVNSVQPADAYSGKILYDVQPTY